MCGFGYSKLWSLARRLSKFDAFPSNFMMNFGGSLWLGCCIGQHDIFSTRVLWWYMISFLYGGLAAPWWLVLLVHGVIEKYDYLCGQLYMIFQFFRLHTSRTM